MKKTMMTAAVFAMLALSACNSAENKIQDRENNSETQPNYVPKQEGGIQPQPVGAQTQQPATNAEGVRLNPPHGEPGHVCEIPVGQPLDGSGGAGNSINVGNTGNQPLEIKTELNTNEQGKPANNTGTVKLNPPHGEPGHVCEIPVGQPLPQ